MPCDGCNKKQEIDSTVELEPGAPGTVTLVYQNPEGNFYVTGPSGREYHYGINRRVVTMLMSDAYAIVRNCEGLVIARVVVEEPSDSG